MKINYNKNVLFNYMQYLKLIDYEQNANFTNKINYI